MYYADAQFEERVTEMVKRYKELKRKYRADLKEPAPQIIADNAVSLDSSL